MAEAIWRGTSWNRTSDTRIFSPLLYQLSYGTPCRAANIGDISKIRKFENENITAIFRICSGAAGAE